MKARMRELGMTQQELADRAGVTQALISQFVLNKAKASRKLPEIALALGMRPEYLATGKGPRLIVDEGPSEGPPVKTWIPLISWVQAGAFCDAMDLLHPGDAEEMLPVPKSLSLHAYALRVQGDSMVSPTGAKSYPPGTIIYVEPEKSPVSGSKVIAKTGEGQVTFKMYQQDAGKHYLVPLNPIYPVITMTDDMSICGVIVASYSEENY